jgi:hypothetical protein
MREIENIFRLGRRFVEKYLRINKNRTFVPKSQFMNLLDKIYNSLIYIYSLPVGRQVRTLQNTALQFSFAP